MSAEELIKEIYGGIDIPAKQQIDKWIDARGTAPSRVYAWIGWCERAIYCERYLAAFFRLIRLARAIRISLRKNFYMFSGTVNDQTRRPRQAAGRSHQAAQGI
jgi:hypothetical protein